MTASSRRRVNLRFDLDDRDRRPPAVPATRAPTPGVRRALNMPPTASTRRLPQAARLYAPPTAVRLHAPPQAAQAGQLAHGPQPAPPLPGPAVRRSPDPPLWPGDITLEPGYTIEAVAAGLTFPSDLTFDDRGRLYVAEAGLALGA